MMKKQLPAVCIVGLVLSGLVLTAACSAQTPTTPPPATRPAQTTPATEPAPASTSQPAQRTVQAAPGTAPIKVQPPPYTGPKYTNRWEVYVGLNLMNGQAGQLLPKRYNMGGIEGMATYWFGTPGEGFFRSHFGLDADYRFGAGTTPVLSPYYNRVVIMQSIIAGGISYKGPRNRYVAINYHALGGATSGIFDYAVNHYPGGSPVSSCPGNEQVGQKGNLGLYCNSTSPYGAVGGSIDFNESGKLAIRLSPDMTFEHFGTELREFFAISMGAVYRFGKNQ
jgi:hypothetical protein